MPMIPRFIQFWCAERRLKMSVPVYEQETTISFSRDEDFADIYTSDSTMMTKYDKFVANKDSPDWVCKREIYDQDGNLCAKIYRTKKKLISARSAITKRELTDEQKQKMADRLRSIRSRKEEV